MSFYLFFDFNVRDAIIIMHFISSSQSTEVSTLHLPRIARYLLRFPIHYSFFYDLSTGGGYCDRGLRSYQISRHSIKIRNWHALAGDSGLLDTCAKYRCGSERLAFWYISEKYLEKISRKSWAPTMEYKIRRIPTYWVLVHQCGGIVITAAWIPFFWPFW